MADSEDINDVFDAINSSEEKILKTGFEEGFEQGSIEGEKEGFVLGLSKGSELGTEIGFYQGFAEGWLSELRSNQEKRSEKTIIQLEKLVNLASQFSNTNSKDVDISDQLRDVRARFKTVCSMLRVSSEFEGSNISW